MRLAGVQWEELLGKGGPASGKGPGVGVCPAYVRNSSRGTGEEWEGVEGDKVMEVMADVVSVNHVRVWIWFVLWTEEGTVPTYVLTGPLLLPGSMPQGLGVPFRQRGAIRGIC